MTNQNQKQPEQSEITQNKPSHLNQGNKTFHPDQQRNQNPEECRQESGQPQDERSRKAS
jgi:hypothetical protein